MKTKPQHTPTPWTRAITSAKNMDCLIVNERGKNIAGVFAHPDTGDADSEFIVRAVNSHEALLEACKRASFETQINGDILTILKQAIAKSEGK